jgi:hypothetical protein
VARAGCRRRAAGGRWGERRQAGGSRTRGPGARGQLGWCGDSGRGGQRERGPEGSASRGGSARCGGERRCGSAGQAQVERGGSALAGVRAHGLGLRLADTSAGTR